jgi:hypothetical protein
LALVSYGEFERSTGLTDATDLRMEPNTVLSAGTAMPGGFAASDNKVRWENEGGGRRVATVVGGSGGVEGHTC